jgi:GMP synthase-like glutamine amidotransferase
MKAAILQTGVPPDPLEARFGRYPDMFASLLGDEYVGPVYDAAAGSFPAAAGNHPAYIVTGSPAGVYDDLPWIAPLKAFLRSASDARLVGICFGHQVMAEALGGRVEKVERGWGVGLQRYDIAALAPWMDGGGSVSIPVSHQDQVVVQPPATTVLGGSAFTPFGMLAWRDRPAISFQFHPEFSPDFAKALIETRRARLPDPDSAIASLDGPDDRERVAGWIRRFLDQ